MTTYFTYRIRNKTTNQHYYGARWKPGCSPKDLWSTYFTSSNKVHALIEKYGIDDFDIEIRKTFTTEQQCRSWEMKVLHRLNVQNNNKWLNIALNTPTMLGRKHSPETIQKMKKPKGPWSQERREAKRQIELTKIRNGKKMPTTAQPVVVFDIEYPSAKHASKDYPQIHYTTLWRWCKQGKNNCSMKLCD